MRNNRFLWAVGLGLLVLAMAIAVVGLLPGQPAAQAASDPQSVDQAVQASGYITMGSGTCFPDAVLVDCNGAVIRQLRGPNGWAFFAPYAGKWTNITAQELTCVAGDKYLNVVTLQVVAAPCGGSTPAATAVPTPGATATPVALPGATVDIQDIGFVPNTITVSVGTRVQWTNRGAIAHTVTHGGGLFDSGNVAPGQMYTYQFNTAGVYVYSDKNNAALTGVVTVQGGAAGNNLAFGRPVRAYTSLTGHGPELAVDGDQSTFWSSYAGSPWNGQNRQWIYVDLGSAQDVSSMHMLWGANRFPRAYALYMWADYCRGWCLLGSTSRGDGDDTWTTNGKVQGQYFLMDLAQPYSLGSAYELREWEILGAGGATPPPAATNLALAKAATSSSQEVGFEAAKGTDGDLTTEYHSAMGLPVWYYVDLGTAQDFDRVDMHWVANMHATSYTLYTWNGRSWSPIYSTRSGPGGDESVRFNTQRSRYVLLYAVAGPANMIGLREFEVYSRTTSSGGGSVTPPPPPAPSPPAPPIPLSVKANGIWTLRSPGAKPNVVPSGLPTVIEVQGGRTNDLLGTPSQALPNPEGSSRD